jgi:hypothetical protein
MNQPRRALRLKQIADRIAAIDRELMKLCPFRTRAGKLHTERMALTAEAKQLTRGDP